MEILDRINSELKEAMKTKNEVAMDTLRAIKSAFNYLKAETGKDPSEQDIIIAIQKEAKKRKDSIQQFRDGGRDDLADKEQAQLEIIAAFLPAEMSDDELEEKIREVIAQVGAQSKKDMGKVMGKAMAELKGKADGNRVKDIVNKLLD